MNGKKLFQEIDYLGSTDEYLAFMHEHFGLEPEAIMEALEAEELEKRESATWEEVLAADGMGGVWEEELAKKKRPQDYPKGWFVLVDHFRGKGSHRDFRVKMNDHLEGFTITDLVEGAIDETIDSLAKANKYKWDNKNTFKFQPDMGDRNVKAVAVKKAQQPCIAEDSFVIKNQTLEKAGSLKVGDRVLTADGTFQKILQIDRVQKNEQFIVKPLFGFPIQTDGDHPFLVNDLKWKCQDQLSHPQRSKLKEFKPIWKQCRDLKIGDILLFPKLKIVTRKEIGNKDFGRLIGYYLGDGNLFRAGNKNKLGEYTSKYCRMYFNSKDEKIIKKYEAILRRLGIHSWRKKPERNCISLVFSCKNIELPKPKIIPQEYLFGNRHFQDGLLEGLVDADGYISNDRRFHFINSNLSLLNGTALILHQRNIFPAFRWRLNWNFSHTKKVGMIGELSWGSKSNFFFDYKRFFGLRVKKIQKAIPKPLVNIITPNHTFCSPYFTTHNTVWLNVRDVVFPKGSVGATKFLPGVFRVVDQGMAYIGTQKSYFKEWFLNGKHFKGRLVFRLIAVRPEWIKKPKGKLQWQCWMTESTSKGQLPYLLSPRGRSRKDVAPPAGESWLPPEWEKKIKAEHRWWPDSKSKQQKIKLMDEAYNDLIEKGEIKARKLKLWHEGGMVKSDALAIIHNDYYIPRKLYDELHEKLLEGPDGWKLGSPYLLSNDAPEEMKKWAIEMRKGLDEGWRKAKLMQDLQTDTAVILMTYGELKAKGWKDEKIIEQIAQNLLPIGFNLEYWKKKVREVLKKYGITITKAMDIQTADEGSKRSFEDFEYLLHHIHIGESGKEEIHHCLLYDHIANMFQQAHLLVKDGKVYVNGKLIKEGIFHIIKGLEPTQKAAWSDEEARENKIKPKKMRAGMTLKEKGEEW